MSCDVMVIEDKKTIMPENEIKLSQDEMIKNLARDYPLDALEFFNPEILKKYGKPVRIDFNIQETKKFSIRTVT